MIENFSAIIGAKIRDFQRKMKQVDQQVKKTAMEATKPITADISDFYTSILEVESLTKAAVKKATKKIDVDINDFYTEMAELQAETKLALKPAKKNIGADISNFVRKAAQVAVIARNLARDKVVVTVVARWNKYQAAMTKYATMTRAIGEVMQNTFQGIGISLSAGLVPIISVLTGVIGNLGPMLGVIAGSTFALASAFVVAGIGAVAFGGLAMTNLKGVFEESKKAKTAMDNLKQTWADIAKSTKAKTVDAFIKVLEILHDALHVLTPMFMSVTDAVGRLVDSLGASFKSDSMTAFFNYLNKSAGPILETVVKGLGGFIMGLLNMITAFEPLTKATAEGFEAMGKSFSDWTAGLSKSEKFQSFVNYVNENMPKVRSIFSDAIQGMINMFAAFAPSSEGMMTSLQDMMERFKNWSSTLSQNEGFKSFISYIKENGPKVAELIGNITTFIVNMGTALAPLGSKILDTVNKFLAWSNTMMENHPIVGKIVAIMLLLGGTFLALIPHIIAFATLFGGAFTAIMAATALMRAKFVLGMTMMVTSMVKTAIAMVVNTAKMVAQWVILGIKSMVNAAKMAAAWLLATGTAMVKAVASMIVTTALFVAKWAVIGAKALLNAAKVAAAWLLSTGVAMATAVASMIATSAVFVAKWVWMGVQALLQAGRMAAAWFIALGPIGWVIGAIIGLAILIILNWEKISAWTKKAWTAVSKAVSDAITKIVGYVQEKFPAIYAIISSYLTMMKTIIVTVWEYIKGTFTNVLAFLKALVTGDFEGMKTAVSNQMALIQSTVSEIWSAVKAYFSTVLGEMLDVVSEKFGEMPGVILGFVDDMTQAGADLISGVISGITGKIGEGLTAIGGFASSLLSRFKKDTGTKSPSRYFANISKYFAPGIVRGIDKTSHLAVNSISGLATSLTDAFTPKLAMADMQANATLNTSVSRADMKAVQHSFAADLGAVEIEQPDLYLVVDGKELGKVVAKPVKDENDRYDKMVKVTKGGR